MSQSGMGAKSTQIKNPKIREILLAYLLVADLGQNHQGEFVFVTSFDEFVAKFMSHVTVGNRKIELSKDCPPTPGHLAEALLADPSSNYQQFEILRRQAESATDAGVLQMVQEVRHALSAPKG